MNILAFKNLKMMIITFSCLKNMIFMQQSYNIIKLGAKMAIVVECKATFEFAMYVVKINL